MMKRVLMMILVAVVVTTSMPADAKVRIAATVPDLAAIARAVGGDRVHVDALSLPTQDPHFVDARPNLLLSLNRADLLVLVGLDLEIGWLPVLIDGARNPRLQRGNEGYLDCSTVVELQQVPKTRIDRSMGDIHPGGNPHYLVDPHNAIRVARAIAQRLARIDPAGAASYQRGGERVAKAIEAAYQRWKAALAPYAGARVVGYHQSWIYFAKAFGLVMSGYLEPKPGLPPNAAHLARLIQLMLHDHVRLVIQEEYYPDKTAQLVADKGGAKLVKVLGGARFAQGESYIERMNALVAKVRAALAGQRSQP